MMNRGGQKKELKHELFCTVESTHATLDHFIGHSSTESGLGIVAMVWS